MLSEYISIKLFNKDPQKKKTWINILDDDKENSDFFIVNVAFNIKDSCVKLEYPKACFIQTRKFYAIIKNYITKGGKN